jgi:hypothetical protein
MGSLDSSGGERYSIDVTRTILKLCDTPERLIRDATGQGHDRRYAVDCTDAEAVLGWQAEDIVRGGGSRRPWPGSEPLPARSTASTPGLITRIGRTRESTAGS